MQCRPVAAGEDVGPPDQPHLLVDRELLRVDDGEPRSDEQRLDLVLIAGPSLARAEPGPAEVDLVRVVGRVGSAALLERMGDPLEDRPQAWVVAAFEPER